VPDQKPPRLCGDERSTLLALLEYQRESLVRKVTGVDSDAALRSPVQSGTTLVWLLDHLAAAESIWVVKRFAGLRLDAEPQSRTLELAIERYRATWARVDDVVAASTLDDVCRGDATMPPVNLRWVLAHLLEETARHAGHADILRELVDNATGR
jgi:uncharacterized damage-inducible protein DinB